MENLEITPIPEIEADQTKMCKIRFDCLVTMYDVGFRKYKGMLGQHQQSPQWFRAQQEMTLESIKHTDPYILGMRIKDMFNQLDATIKQYEG